MIFEITKSYKPSFICVCWYPSKCRCDCEDYVGIPLSVEVIVVRVLALCLVKSPRGGVNR